MDCAEKSILCKGFASTSIDELIVSVGISKSGFFYHFKDKNELAKALLLRYLEREDQMFDDLFKRADELNNDPLHGFLIVLKLLAEAFENLDDVHPGCIVASYCYQDRLFNQEIRDLTSAGVLRWRKLFYARLVQIAERYPPNSKVDLNDLADMVATVVEGGLVLARVTKDKQTLPNQIMLYRSFIRMIFEA